MKLNIKIDLYEKNIHEYDDADLRCNFKSS